MKRTILFFIYLMGMTFAFAQTSLQDVVYLKNGSIIRGDIVEMISGETVKIMTADGSVFVYPFADVEKFSKEEAIGLKVPNNVYNVEKKSPWVSGLLSFWIPGLGQFYNGETRKGCVDLGIQVVGWTAMVVGVGLETIYLPEDFIRVDGGYYSPPRDIFVEGEHCHNSEFLRTAGIVLQILGSSTFIANSIHTICDAVKSSKRINAENGFVMYQLNDRCAFGMQPSIAYERPQYLQGYKPELSAGMKFKLTF